MNVYTYLPEKHCLRKKPEFNEPIQPQTDSQRAWRLWETDNDVYLNHLASLREIPCAPGTVWDANRDYKEDFDFGVRNGCCKGEDMTRVKCYNNCSKDFLRVAYPKPEHWKPLPVECQHEPLIDTGVGYYHCPACKKAWTYGEWKRNNGSAERTFTLADMIECWEAGRRYGADEWVSTERGLDVDEPDMKQYFKSKGIELP